MMCTCLGRPNRILARCVHNALRLDGLQKLCWPGNTGLCTGGMLLQSLKRAQNKITRCHCTAWSRSNALDTQQAVLVYCAAQLDQLV